MSWSIFLDLYSLNLSSMHYLFFGLYCPFTRYHFTWATVHWPVHGKGRYYRLSFGIVIFRYIHYHYHCFSGFSAGEKEENKSVHYRLLLSIAIVFFVTFTTAIIITEKVSFAMPCHGPPEPVHCPILCIFTYTLNSFTWTHITFTLTCIMNDNFQPQTSIQSL